MKTRSIRTCFACLAVIFAISHSAYSEITMIFRGIIDSSIATYYPVATTSYAVDGDSVIYTVVMPDISAPNEQFPGLFTYAPLRTSIEIGNQTYSSTSTIYTGFHDYLNPAIGTYNGVFLQDTYGENLYGQFALYNLTGAQTTDAMGILTPSGLIPVPGADSSAGYNIGILHFSDSQSPQAHTYWHITNYSIAKPPAIQCPTPITVIAQSGQCSAPVIFSVTTDNIDPMLEVTATPPSGSLFSIGTNVVRCVAVDASGNSNTCSFTITVVEKENPVIQIPANIEIPCNVSLLSPAYYSVTATDNCDLAPILAVNPPSGSGFPVGTTWVTATAQDASGNSATSSFTVARAALGFNGFLAPISGADATGGTFAYPRRTFRVGQTIPVEFVASCGGANVVTGIHTLQLVKYSNETNSDTPIDAIPQCNGSSGNQFHLVGGKWFFNLDTRATGISPGKWKLIATLSDGSTHFVWLQFKK